MQGRPSTLITNLDVREYFQSAVATALDRRSVAARDETAIYLANLLTSFVRAEVLYEPREDGVWIRPLAEIYASALGAGTRDDRNRNLKRLGDVALFLAGLFSGSLSRSLVDVDYYIAMGGNAYGHLAGARPGPGSRTMKDVFTELAVRFGEFVEVLAEVGDNTNLSTSHDVLRLYEIWLSTGSRRAAEKLRRCGIDPVPARRQMH